MKGRHPALPVLVLTGRGDARTQQEALDAGTDRFLPKPFDPLELEAVVKRLLPGRHARRRSRAG